MSVPIMSLLEYRTAKHWLDVGYVNHESCSFWVGVRVTMTNVAIVILQRMQVKRL